MSIDSTRRQWVLETVDRLRQRKARPDLERISRMVERFHGLTYTETKESLDSLVEEGTVIKVHFKGNVSYRHVRRPTKEPNESPTHKYDTTSRILMGIKGIMKETGDGVCLEDLERWLVSKEPNTRLVKHRLVIALQREVETGIVTKLPGNCYVLTESLPKEKKVQERPTCVVKSGPKLPKEKIEKAPIVKAPIIKPSPVEKEKNEEQPSTSKDLKDVKADNEEHEEKEQPRRGRPLSKRKKFKKTHGPDFENPLEIKTKLPGKDKMEEEEEEEGEKKEEGEPTCAFCSQTAQVNPLLICMDCKVKAHPACMDYSPELARRALNSPWQCMDCKMCCMCDGAENADLMLFCDACDKGYHMTCHQPPLTNKPKGKWVCFACKKKVNKPATIEPKIEPSEKVQEDISRRRGRKRKGSLPPSPKMPNKFARSESVKSESVRSDAASSEDGIKSENTEPAVSEITGTPKSVSRIKWVKPHQGSRILKVARSESVRSESVRPDVASSEDGIKSENNEPAPTEITGNTNATTCLLTPSASPRPSDTFDYEMKMSLCGMTFPLIEDNTTYSDATNWNILDGACFFEECGHFSTKPYCYEMKMSLCGMTFPLIEDNTTYSDATNWNIVDVARFFEECGFKEEAQVFSDQEVDGKSLLLMRREDVISGLGLKLGPAVKIYKKVVRLQQYSQAMLYS